MVILALPFFFFPVKLIYPLSLNRKKSVVFGFSLDKLLLQSDTTIMANDEELSEDSNSNGLDSFDAVKKRFKDRSKVTD